MPTVLRIGPYRFFFYSNEGIEPPHVHVSSAGCEAKFWLQPVGFAWARGYNQHEMREIARYVQEHHVHLIDARRISFGGNRGH